MTQRCTSQMIIELLQEKVGVPADIPNIETATWDELGVESLGLTEIFSSLELQLSTSIPHDEALNTRTIQELTDLVNKQLCTQ